MQVDLPATRPWLRRSHVVPVNRGVEGLREVLPVCNIGVVALVGSWLNDRDVYGQVFREPVCDN